ncbi:MAG: hypothetical protein QM820_38565 [Minicystis sp.]
MKRFDSLALLLSTSLLVLTACGQSVIGGGAGGNGGTGSAGGEGGDVGVAGGLGYGTCNGAPSPVSCVAGGCPEGYVCVADDDPNACHPSMCTCEAQGWGCTKDCEPFGSSCVPLPETCNGEPNPANCTTGGCPVGFVCAPDPDPNGCRPSICTCDASGWICTADCAVNGNMCVQEQ